MRNVLNRVCKNDFPIYILLFRSLRSLQNSIISFWDLKDFPTKSFDEFFFCSDLDENFFRYAPEDLKEFVFLFTYELKKKGDWRDFPTKHFDEQKNCSDLDENLFGYV